MDKKNKTEITPSIDIFDNEMLTEAGLGLNLKTKKDTNFKVGVDKIFLKNSEDKDPPKKISAGVSKTKGNLTYRVEGSKAGDNKALRADVTFGFNIGGEVELVKGQDYIKDLL